MFYHCPPYPEVTQEVVLGARWSASLVIGRCFLWIKPMTPCEKLNAEFQSSQAHPASTPALAPHSIATAPRSNRIQFHSASASASSHQRWPLVCFFFFSFLFILSSFQPSHRFDVVVGHSTPTNQQRSSGATNGRGAEMGLFVGEEGVLYWTAKKDDTTFVFLLQLSRVEAETAITLILAQFCRDCRFELCFLPDMVVLHVT